jgi:hypothetical protein
MKPTAAMNAVRSAGAAQNGSVEVAITVALRYVVYG